MGEHHVEGMSRWPSLAECIAFQSKHEENDATRFGSRSHAYLEALIKGATLPPATNEEREAAEWAAEFIEEFVGGRAPINSETKVTISDRGMPCDGIFGTCDIWFVIDGQLFVCDFKSIGFTDRDYKPQLMGYAYALSTDPSVNIDDSKPVVGKILHGGSHYVSTYEFAIGEAQAFANQLIADSRDSKPSDATPCHSCSYCACYPCEKVQSQLAVIEKRWASTSLAARMDLAKLAKAFAERTEEMVKKVLAEGGIVCDPDTGAEWIYKERNGAAPLADLDGLANFMINGVGMSREEFLATVKVSKTTLVDYIVAKSENSAKILSKKEAAKAVAPFFGEATTIKVLNRTNKKDK